MSEFEEIAHSGGKIEFKQKEGGGFSVGFSQSNPWGVAIFQVCVSLNGELLGVLPMGGIGSKLSIPENSIPAWVISDKESMFGRKCSQCNSYFRTSSCGDNMFCPYCGHFGSNVSYTTDNQYKFIEAYCNAYIEAYNGDKDVIIDLNNISDQLPDNKPQWVYSEQRQQNRYACSKCKVIYDMLGYYGACPRCNNLNFLEVIEGKFNDLEQQFKEAHEKTEGRHEREVEWEKLMRCVSEFEAMANDLKKYLVSFPAIPKRKVDLQQLSFQKLLNANECFNNWYGFEILKEISPTDRKFMNVMFNRRHIFTHNAGKVDQEYLDNTNDSTVRLNQVIRFKSKEIKRLIPLLRRAAVNLIEGFECIN